MTFMLEERISDSPLIETIWRARSEHTGSLMSIAATGFEMVVTRDRGETTLTIRGPETKATPLAYERPDVEWIGIRFKLGAFLPDLPPEQLRDRRDMNLPGANGNSFWFDSAAWEFPTYDNAETFVTRLVQRRLLVHDPVVEAVLRGEPQKLSQRYLQKRFLRATGLTHSIIRQIERARKAKALLEQGASILDTVAETGYFDQSHLTNSLKRFVGQTPAQLTG